jgi:Fe2+ or Zn2+ uptake regulation protein
MASKRGLSNEEKRKRMLDWFFEKQDFFQLKEIETQCSKEKGITMNTIKDILTALVDDGLVQSEKIGTCVYFWSFPSQLIQKRQHVLDDLTNNIELESKRCDELKEKFAKINDTQADDKQKIKDLIENYEEANEEKKKIADKLSTYEESDPEKYDKLKREIQQAKKTCNNWIDNIFTMKSYFKTKYKADERMINKQFEIPEDLDYIE